VEFSKAFTVPDPLGVFVSERLQHGQSITLGVMNAKRYAELMFRRLGNDPEMI
jgi:hypothetical protein